MGHEETLEVGGSAPIFGRADPFVSGGELLFQRGPTQSQLLELGLQGLQADPRILPIRIQRGLGFHQNQNLLEATVDL